MAREAAFGPVIPEVLPPDYEGRSQGIKFTSDTGWADAFGDIAKASGALVAGVDQEIQSAIRTDATKGFDDISADFGVEDATNQAGLSEPTPHAIKNGERRLQGLTSQFQSGLISERHYYASLNMLARQLKANYPGYREQVDNIINDVTGIRPANQLQAALFAEAEASAKAKTEDEKFIERAGMDGTLPPDYYDRKGTPGAYTIDEVKKYSFDKNRLVADQAAQNQALTLRAASGTATEDDALTTYVREINSDVNLSLRDASTVVGKSFAELQTMIKSANEQAGAGKFSSPEQKAQISAGLVALETNLRTALQAKATSGVYSGLLKDKTKVNNAIDLAMAPVYNMKAAFAGEKADLSALASTAAQIEAITDAATADIFAKIPVAATHAGLVKAVGPEQASLYLGQNSELQSVYVKALTDYQKARIQTEEGFNVLKSLSETELTKSPDAPKAQKEILKHWTYVIDKAAKGEIPPDVYQKNVRFMFAPETLELMSTLDPADRTEYLKLVTSPTVTRNMVVLKQQGDKESWNLYKNWTTTAFQAVFRDEVQELQTYQVDNQLMDIQFDDKSNQFVMVPNADVPDRGLIGNIGAKTRLKEAQSLLKELNTQLQVIAPIVEEEGLETSDQIAGLLQGMGLDLDVEQTGTIGDQLWEAVQAAGTIAKDNLKKEVTGEGKKKMIWDTGPVSRKYRRPEDRVKIIEEIKVNPE